MAKQLTAEDWLDLALEELRETGYVALKAQPLAKKLNVTRGSFYYHFESLERFHEAVIAQWAKRTTSPVIETVDAVPAPDEALHRLLQITLQSGEALERAVRSWATVNAQVAHAVEHVDLGRIAVAEGFLTALGLPPDEATARAKLLYWAAIGRLMMPFPDKNRLTANQITKIAELMSSSHP